MTGTILAAVAAGAAVAGTAATAASPGMLDPGSYAAMGWLLMSGGGLALAVDRILHIADRFKEQPPARDTYVTIKEWRAHEGRLAQVERMVEEMRDEFRAMDAKDETRAIALHNRINPLEGDVSRLAGQLELVNQRVCSIDAKMDRMMER